MKIFAVVVAYHPKIDEFLRNIDRYIDKVDHVVVYCNSDEFVPSLGVYGDRITLLGEGGGNVGIGKAVNEAVRWGVRRGYEYIMTMDQDSYWEEIDSYFDCISRNDDPTVAMFDPYIETASGNGLETPEEFIIQSGAVYRMDFFGKAGLFREDYIIDAVDLEICLRAAKYGYTIGHTGLGHLIHTLGYKSRIRNTKYFTENYSAFRLYYMRRNSFWVWKEYHHRQFTPSATLFYSYYCIKHILLGEDKKISKIWAMLRGIVDGVFTRPLPPPRLT